MNGLEAKQFGADGFLVLRNPAKGSRVQQMRAAVEQELRTHHASDNLPIPATRSASLPSIPI